LWQWLLLLLLKATLVLLLERLLRLLLELIDAVRLLLLRLETRLLGLQRWRKHRINAPLLLRKLLRLEPSRLWLHLELRIWVRKRTASCIAVEIRLLELRLETGRLWGQPISKLIELAGITCLLRLQLHLLESLLLQSLLVELLKTLSVRSLPSREASELWLQRSQPVALRRIVRSRRWPLGWR
jgi:hypothetical protein